MTVLPVFTTVDNEAFAEFSPPCDLAYRADDDCLVFCGHFDGHDAYYRTDANLFVLVYGSDPSAVFESSWEKAHRWLDAHPLMDEWCSMRAVVKARKSLSRKLDVLVGRLDQIVVEHEDDSEFGVRVCDACAEASDMIKSFRKGAGL